MCPVRSARSVSHLLLYFNDETSFTAIQSPRILRPFRRNRDGEYATEILYKDIINESATADRRLGRGPAGSREGTARSEE